jgi:transglutaminase-like putative cysteine protease
VRRFVRVCCALCACLLPLWPEGAAAEEPILHEFLSGVDPNEVRAIARPVVPPPDDAQGDQARRARADDTARASDDNAGPGPDEAGDDADLPVSRPHSATPNPENFRPDRLTSLEGSLDYYEAFNPSVAPFKRVTAFGAVRLDVDGKTPVLGIEDSRRRVVPVEGEQAPAPDARPRDRFVGEIDLDFHANPAQPLALPTVSPESRVLTLTTQPKLDLQIERDAADNMFVRARGAIPDGTVHVRWDTDAPRAYFGADIPTTKLRDLPKLPKLERSIARRAQHFAGQLGITANTELRTALEKLTSHFRSFVESAEPPANTGDLYLDLVQGGKGLCRHRAYGFVVTARALKIEARFAQNEAHSWVEVRLPETGFIRIDLGGASHGLTAHDTHDRKSYVPAQPDTLPRPAAYRQSHARAARDNPAPASQPLDPATEAASLSGRWLPDGSEAGPQSLGPGKSGPGAGATPRSGSVEPPGVRQSVRLVLEDRRISAVRGGKLVLTGRAVDDNERGVAGLRVEVWIRRVERQQRMLLAVQVSDADGYFRADFGVPPDLAVGDYRLLVRSDGDAEHLPSASSSYD